MAALVQEKKRLFRLKRKKTSVLGHPQDVNADLESMEENYNRAKRAAKLAIFKAKNAERLKFCEELKDEDQKGNVFRVAKQLVRKNRDVVGAGCVRDNSGKIVVEEDKLLEVWKEHYDKISNEEFKWDREGLTDVRPVCGLYILIHKFIIFYF